MALLTLTTVLYSRSPQCFNFITGSWYALTKLCPCPPPPIFCEHCSSLWSMSSNEWGRDQRCICRRKAHCGVRESGGNAWEQSMRSTCPTNYSEDHQLLWLKESSVSKAVLKWQYFQSFRHSCGFFFWRKQRKLKLALNKCLILNMAVANPLYPWGPG